MLVNSARTVNLTSKGWTTLVLGRPGKRVRPFNKVLKQYETYSTVGNKPNNWLLYIVNGWNTNNTVGSVLELYGPNVQWNSMATLNQS